jgi:hypothetical protein
MGITYMAGEGTRGYQVHCKRSLYLFHRTGREGWEAGALLCEAGVGRKPVRLNGDLLIGTQHFQDGRIAELVRMSEGTEGRPVHVAIVGVAMACTRPPLAL